MPEPNTTKPTAPPPKCIPSNHEVFDPWNSASTGHQRAENPYSHTTAWRDTRLQKLSAQFASDASRKRAGDWRWISGEEAQRRSLGCQDIRSFMGVTKRRVEAKENLKVKKDLEKGDLEKKDLEKEDLEKERKILSGTTIYINGSTMPTISDHRLKHLLAEHGASIAIGLARRSVTHVIVAKPNTRCGHGVGGGLAAGKLQREIDGRTIRMVGVEWALESIKAGKRLPESRFAVVHAASRGQRSVKAYF
ncbi:hypothetical protein ASPZODRAFT_126388 [Penicilliopsis zonata CBS 506.65]|uniref:BRCT domain-containing protein n=1 Tax=Penicilliopsis zonata CBS 506.65 TaxID=1073090 RepID=A0A1L9STQ8_9EURO|nr:hypothetical protein ASPZODRAFT_126388 [Penicilliopsis zonata CBS 506.65]OJJ50504.1 hypothetical protein ASPZODRAFT_126388 [Penicilliopsis zonata CBS 506.65]